MSGKYVVNLVGTSEFHWSLKARDSQTMLTSPIYAGKGVADAAIEACRINSADEARYERMAANDSRYYFVLRTAEGEVIATSETYYTARAREKGIAMCKESGPLGSVSYVSPR